MTKPVIVLFIGLAVAGCSDTVRTEFDTLDDARRAKAFSRGWLPPLLPVGATDIVEINDLDLNIGHGSFRFPAESTDLYLETLGAQHGAAVIKSTFRISVVLTNADTRWNITLDTKYQTGTYEVKNAGRAQNHAP